MITKRGKEYKKLKAVSRCTDMSYILGFMDKILCKIIHHRNQLKHFRGTKPLVLENLNAVEIEIDFSENLDKPVKYEPQSLHWTSDQLSGHSGIHFVNDEKSFHVHMSDDLDHDQAFVDQAMGTILEVVGSDADGKCLVVCSDNCTGQYKSAENFYNLQMIANKYEATLIRIYGVANHGKGQVDCAKIAIRNEVARTGRYFSTASECVQFLKKKFEGKTNPCYYIEELHTNDLNEKREEHKYMTFTTIDGSSIFRVIIFEPFSTTIKAAPRLCACPMCLENFGSCDLKTYEPIVHHLKRPALRSACLGFQKTNDDENTNIDDFFLPGSICDGI